MKVLLCHNYYRTSAPSGEDIIFKNEREMLRSRGVDVFSFEKYNDELADLSLTDKLKLGISNSWSSESYNEIRSVIQKFKPDLVHFHNTFPQISPSGYAACRSLNVPVLQTLHNFRLLCANALLLRDGKVCELCLSGNLLPALKYKCYRDSFFATSSQVLNIFRNRINGSFFNNVDRYITLTEFAKRKFIQAGYPSKKFVTRPNFLIDSPEQKKSYSDYAIFVGRISPEKGLGTLLAAWKRIEGFRIKIVGSGDLIDKSKEFVRTNKINAEFIGQIPRSEVISLIRDAKFMILPSECYEGFPLSILEAFACGTPVIVSDIGGQSEIVVDGINGLKFNAGDIDSLENKIKDLIGNDSKVNKLGNNARKQYEKNYNQQSVFERTIKIYESVKSEQ